MLARRQDRLAGDIGRCLVDGLDAISQPLHLGDQGYQLADRELTVEI
jgi:hypothetical protein